MRILIVEDDLISRLLMQEILRPYGDCDVAVNGKEALRAFEYARKEKKPYHAVFLDIMMPEMDGQEVLREIRRLEKEEDATGGNEVKIIMVTAVDDRENVKLAFREQCEAYLIKPVDPAKLKETLMDLELICPD